MEKMRKAGRDAKEDISIELYPKPQGGLKIEILSTGKNLEKDRIHALVESTAGTLGLKDLRIVAKDKGALEWMIQARVEAAAKQYHPEIEVECTPEFQEENHAGGMP